MSMQMILKKMCFKNKLFCLILLKSLTFENILLLVVLFLPQVLIFNTILALLACKYWLSMPLINLAERIDRTTGS